jgi:voltage-gated potassium channel
MNIRDEKGHVIFPRWLELFLQVLILANLVSFALETVPNLTDDQQYALHWFEIISIAIFTVEYLARCVLSRPVLRYAFSLMGVVDLLAILPFYLTAGLDFRSARAFRMLRLFKLTRYSMAARRFRHAFVMVREEMVLFGSAALIVLYLAAVGIHYFESEAQPQHFSSVPQSFWWAIVTLTTVGYGDAVPITVAGRVFTSLVLVIGLGFVAVPTGLLAGALAKARENEKRLEEQEAAQKSASAQKAEQE